jgi:hypothetical protein
VKSANDDLLKDEQQEEGIHFLPTRRYFTTTESPEHPRSYYGTHCRVGSAIGAEQLKPHHQLRTHPRTPHSTTANASAAISLERISESARVFEHSAAIMPMSLEAPVLQVDANVIHKVDTTNPANLFSMWTGEF